MKKENLKLKDNDFIKKLTSLIVPMTLQNFVFALIPVSDSLMLVALNQDAMSAVSLSAQIMMVLNLFLFGITSGANMFAAQYWGKGDKRSIERVAAYSVFLTIPVMLLFFLAAILTPRALIRIYSNVPEIIAYGESYLRVVSFAYIFMSLAMLFESVLKNTGFVKHCTVISIISVFLNIALNAVFIFGLLGAPRMEASGAALATTISNGFACFSCLFLLVKKCSVKIRFKDIFSLDLGLRKDFSKYSAPYLANQLLWGIGFTMISVIIGHLGSDATAANSIVFIIKDVVSCLCYALGGGGAIVVGNELGANRFDTGKEYGDRILKIAIISGLILGILTALFTPIVVRFVNLSPVAIGYLKAMMYMNAYYICGRSINCVVIGGILGAGGDTKFGFICDTLTMWAFIVPVGMLAAFVWHLPVIVVYFILNLDEMIKIPVVLLHYKKYKWVKNIVNKVA